MRHIIKKQVLELKLDTDRDMFRIQQKASDYYYKYILPAIEKVLDGLTDDEHMIQIDKLEVDLGGMEWEAERLEMNMEDMYLKIEKQAKKAVQQILDQQYLNNKYGKVSVVLEKPIAEYACEQWLHYMRNGYLPWNVFDVNDQWRLQVLEALATDYRLVSEIKTLIKTNQPVRERLIQDHPVSFLVKLMEVLTANEQNSLPQLVQEIEMLLNHGERSPLQMTERLRGKVVKSIWHQFLRGAVDNLSNIDIAKNVLCEKVSGRQWNETTLYKGDVPLLWPVLENFPGTFLFPGNDTVVIGKENKTSEPSNDDYETNKLRDKKEAGITDGKDEQKIEMPVDGIFAPHAGLVLLHPFMRHLFLHAGLIENGKFIGQEAQEKAIWLLHFVATGNIEAEEYQLVAPKILCGYPLEQSPDTNIELDEAIKTEAIEMMGAVIEQWTILKNTSVDGLREGFLQRNGKIYRKNDDTCFAIETHAIDVLLDHLPWNLGIVKLPWIKELIKVEWR